MQRDLALKVLAFVKGVRQALADLMDTMFIIYQPKNWYGAVGDTASFTVTAMNVSTYRWQTSSDGGTTWKNSSTSTTGYNAPTISFLMEERLVGILRRCKLTDADGNELYTDVVQTILSQEGE